MAKLLPQVALLITLPSHSLAASVHVATAISIKIVYLGITGYYSSLGLAAQHAQA
jgi:hypothetical protein